MTNEEMGLIALIMIVALAYFFNYLKKVEKKKNKPKAKAKKVVTLESLEKRVIALEKAKTAKG